LKVKFRLRVAQGQGLSFAPCLNKGAKLWTQLIAPKATFSSIHKIDKKVGLVRFYVDTIGNKGEIL